MPMDDPHDLTSLDDAEVVRRLHALHHDSCVVLGSLLVYLGEVEHRRLYASAGYDSMHGYCVRKLGMSDQAAFKRLRVARMARELPAIIEGVGAGRLHLSGLVVLCPHLTEANHAELLEEASGKSRRDVERLLAVRFPKPDAATSIRRVPAQRAPDPPASPQPTPPPSADVGPATPAPVPNEPPALVLETSEPMPSRPMSRVEPLSADRYRVTFTAPASLVATLEEVRALLGHAVPDGDVAEIVERGLELLKAQALKKRFGARAAGGKGRRTKKHSSGDAKTAKEVSPGTVDGEPKRRSRHIPAAIRSAVWSRDGGACTYVAPDGTRCASRKRLELHHTEPFARGGEHTVDALSLRCRTHNQLAAQQDFGRGFVERRIDESGR